VFGKHNVSINSVVQKGQSEESVPLIFVTHKAKEISLKRAVEDISYIPEVIKVANVIRVEK
jgi:homoserine dehydrogenase